MAIQQDYAATGWLQAFMGAQDPTLQQARIFSKKHIDWIDTLSSLTTIREKSDSLDGALTGIWDYATSNELRWLLTQVPSAQVDWVLSSTEEFTLHRAEPPEINDAPSLGKALGIRDWETKLMMRILRSDFATWQRKSARSGGGAPIGFTVATSESITMELPCTARWTANQWVDGTWNFSIDGQPHMVAEADEAIQVVRPEFETMLDSMLHSILWADKNLRTNKSNSGALEASTIPIWIQPGDAIVPLHEAVYGGKHGLAVSKTFVSVWDAIWPIVYCRRKRLNRGYCEMKLIRSQLDQAFQTEPRLVTWMFVFGELLSQWSIGDGLGISAKYLVGKPR